MRELWGLWRKEEARKEMGGGGEGKRIEGIGRKGKEENDGRSRREKRN